MSISVWRSPKVGVRESVYGGLGVFAAARIAAGEIVAVKAGHIVDAKEAIRLARDLGDYSLQIEDDLFLSPRSAEEYDDLVIHMSHSCNANVGFSGQVVYVAMREIAADEELCHDYAMARTAPYEMACSCGTGVCRGTITHEDWMRADVQGRYVGFFMPHVQRRIDARA